MAEFDYEVVNGRKIRVRPQEVVSEIDENGYFVRQPNHFTEGFGEGKNPVEKGRYHLVWAKLCHWSNRASIVRELLGLEDASVSTRLIMQSMRRILDGNSYTTKIISIRSLESSS